MADKATAGVPITLHSLATTGNGTIIGAWGLTKHLVLIRGTAESSISAGKVKVEAASAADYSGTWALIGSEITVGTNTEQAVAFTGPYPFIRARVSTTVEGGTVTVTYLGAP